MRFEPRRSTLRAMALAALVLPGAAATALAQQGEGRLKVFVLAGQSNMEGQGAVGTLDWLGEDPSGSTPSSLPRVSFGARWQRRLGRPPSF